MRLGGIEAMRLVEVEGKEGFVFASQHPSVLNLIPFALRLRP